MWLCHNGDGKLPRHIEITRLPSCVGAVNWVHMSLLWLFYFVEKQDKLKQT